MNKTVTMIWTPMDALNRIGNDIVRRRHKQAIRVADNPPPIMQLFCLRTAHCALVRTAHCALQCAMHILQRALRTAQCALRGGHGTEKKRPVIFRQDLFSGFFSGCFSADFFSADFFSVSVLFFWIFFFQKTPCRSA